MGRCTGRRGGWNWKESGSNGWKDGWMDEREGLRVRVGEQENKRMSWVGATVDGGPKSRPAVHANALAMLRALVWLVYHSVKSSLFTVLHFIERQSNTSLWIC